MIIVLLIWRITAPPKDPCKNLSPEQRQHVSRILDDLERVSDKIEIELAKREDQYSEEEDQLDSILQQAETGLCQHYDYAVMIDANLTQLLETLVLDHEIPWRDDDIPRTIAKLQHIFNMLPLHETRFS